MNTQTRYPRLLDDFERRYRNDHVHEHGLLIDAWGVVVVKRDGDYDSVEFMSDELKKAAGGFGTHTHPRALPPSVDDLALAAQYGLTLRAVGVSPEGELWEYTVRFEAPNMTTALKIRSNFDNWQEYYEKLFAKQSWSDLQWEREARDQAVRRAATEYDFFYERVLKNAELSEAKRSERQRLDMLSSADATLREKVLAPLHDQVSRSLRRYGSGPVPVTALTHIQNDIATAVQTIMLGKPDVHGALSPYSVIRGEVVPRSVYMATLWSLMQGAASMAIERHAAMMRKKLPEDLLRYFENATVSPFENPDGPAFDPLHLWMGPDKKQLADRIWTAAGDLKRKLTAFVTTGIASGKSAVQIDDDMGAFLNGAGGYEPMRLGRTMTAFAFSHADAAAAQNNPFVDKFNFYTAPQHKCCDVCDDVEANNPYPKDDIRHMPPQHPECLLPGTRVDIPGSIQAATQAFYDGICIKVTTRNGLQLSVTPNHPILTSKGWVAAELLTKGDQVICATNAERIVNAINPDNRNLPALIEDVFCSLKETSGMVSTSVPVSAEDFHGDARFFDGNVDVVYPDSTLLSYLQPFASQPISKLSFGDVRTSLIFLDAQRVGELPIKTMFGSSHSDMSLLGHSIPIFETHSSVHEWLTSFEGPDGLTRFNQAVSYSTTRDAEPVSEFLDRFASDVAPDDVVKIERFSYVGHVYNLQVDPYGLYISNGIITHNCICRVEWIESEAADDIIDRLRRAIRDGLTNVRKSIGDIIGPLSRRFLDLLFRGEA